MAKSLTSANAIILLSVPGLISTPQQLQGFAAEDIFDADAIDVAETVMGADGKMSAGWVPSIKVLNVTLQADSDSVDLFEQWYAAQVAVREIYFGAGSVYLRATQRKYQLVKIALKNYKPLPDGKKILQSRKFALHMEDITSAAI